MNGDLTKNVIEISKRMLIFAIYINFITYGFKIFLTTMRAKLKNKIGEAEQEVDLNDKTIKPPSMITIIASVFVTFAFAYALEHWSVENPFSLYRYILYCFTLFFVQIATYRTAVKSILDLIPTIAKKLS